MEKFTTSNIRNVCLVGHSTAGKTSLTEAMLYITKGSQRLGKIVDGNTVCDYDPEEVKRQVSISASVEVTHKNLTDGGSMTLESICITLLALSVFGDDYDDGEQSYVC